MANDPNTFQYVIQEDGFWYVASKDRTPGVPETTVSSKGVANGLSTEYNDGYDFGPDSYNPSITSGVPLTQTSGIQEMATYLIELSPTLSGQRPGPVIRLGSGIFNINADVVLPAGNGTYSLTIAGNGRNVTWLNFTSNAAHGIVINPTNVGDYVVQDLALNNPTGTGITYQPSAYNGISFLLDNVYSNAGGTGNVVDIENVDQMVLRDCYLLTPNVVLNGCGHVYMFGGDYGQGTTISHLYSSTTERYPESIELYGTLLNGSRVILNAQQIALFSGVSFQANSSELTGILIDNTQAIGILDIQHCRWTSPGNKTVVGLNSGTSSATIQQLRVNGFYVTNNEANTLIASGITVDVADTKTIYNNGTSTLAVPINATTVSGTTAGSFVAHQVNFEAGYKKVIIYLDGYENDSTTAQTYTFPVAFSTIAEITSNTASVPVVSTSLTEFSIAPDTTTAYTGIIVIEGY